MIIVKLSGGLGNQMFQYAAGYGLASKFNKKLILDISSYKTYKNFNYELGNLKIKARLATSNEVLYSRILRKTPQLQKFNLFPYYYKENSSAQYDLSYINKSIILEGYFQSNKYINNIAELREQFKPIGEFAGRNLELMRIIKNTQSVMLHVRRGDYITKIENYKVHGVCDTNYYKKAISIIKNKINNPHFIIFSDDIDWVRKTIEISEDSVFVDWNSKMPTLDINLMSECKYHIISNSTFSWWAARLSKHDNGIVISPKQWFNDTSVVKNYDEFISNLIPSEWLSI
jgi:hypothetical protein